MPLPLSGLEVVSCTVLYCIGPKWAGNGGMKRCTDFHLQQCTALAGALGGDRGLPTNSVRHSAPPPQSPYLWGVGVGVQFRQTQASFIPEEGVGGAQNKQITRVRHRVLTSLTPALTASCVASAVCFFTAAYGSFPLCIHASISLT